jgi:anti-sigma regulatory factor (Ser/Thr protein kinase)
VKKKVFAYFLDNHHGDGIVAACVKGDKRANAKLVAAEPKRFFSPAYIGPRGYLGVRASPPTRRSRATRSIVSRPCVSRCPGPSASSRDGMRPSVARAEAGLPNEERAEENVGTLAEALVRAARDDGRHPGVEVAFACSEPAATRVRAVAHRLDALVRELLENARSFAGEGGRVDVRVEGEGDEVVVTVSDTGPGIGPEDLPRVFSRFFTTRGRARGTGLGLALVQAVAQAHGGSVSVRSSPGRGATFEVRLPHAR